VESKFSPVLYAVIAGALAANKSLARWLMFILELKVVVLWFL